MGSIFFPFFSFSPVQFVYFHSFHFVGLLCVAYTIIFHRNEKAREGADHRSSRLNWKVKGLQVLKLNFCVISINRFSFRFVSLLSFSFHFFGGRVCLLFFPITIIICCHFLSVWSEKKNYNKRIYIDCCWVWVECDFQMSSMIFFLFILIENFHPLLLDAWNRPSITENML